jgi:mannosyltransferase OCH1-like enzyme
MRSWRDAHPTWEYRVWSEEEVSSFGLENATLYDRCRAAGRSDAAADVARTEILLRNGGVYVDADSECRRTLDGAPFLGSGFFAAHEPSPLAQDLISNAFMGAEPGHPILRRYVDALATVQDPLPPWKRTGPLLLTEVIGAGDEPDVEILAAWTFLTQTPRGEPVTGGEPYGEHHFSSTAERGAEFIGAEAYPA